MDVFVGPNLSGIQNERIFELIPLQHLTTFFERVVVRVGRGSVKVTDATRERRLESGALKLDLAR